MSTRPPQTHAVQIARDIAILTHQTRLAFTDAATLSADILDLLPKRGDLTDAFLELVRLIAETEQIWLQADEITMNAALTVDWESLNIDPLPVDLPDEPAA
jgi:hypothetical protein